MHLLRVEIRKENHILVSLVIGAIPAWRYSRRWGYGRTGFLGLILVVLLVPWLLGVIG